MLTAAAPTARILIAADAPLEALALEDMLRGAGYCAVRVTSDAREIAPLLGKWPYALLVLDMNIRPLNSLAMLEYLAGHVNQHHLAVLALTDADDEVTQDRALGLGAADVLSRPLTRDETIKRVRAALASLSEPRTDDVVMRAVSKRFTPMM